MTDEIRWPINHTIGYWLSYPLMLAMLGALALVFVTTGLLLSAMERFVWRVWT